jgi:hypothetical protein
VSAPTQPDMPVHCEALLREINAQLHRQLAHIDQALALAEMKIRALEERLRLERIAKYGKRSETLSDLSSSYSILSPASPAKKLRPRAGASRSKHQVKTNKKSRRTRLKINRGPSIPAARHSPAILRVSSRSLFARRKNALAVSAAIRRR